MSTPRRRVFALVLLLTLLLPSIVVSIARSESPRVEVLHMWRAQSEQNALAVFRDDLRSVGVEWSDYGVTRNFEGVQQEFISRLAMKSPPSVVQWIIGEDMKRLVSDGVFRLIPDKDQRFKSILQPEIYELVSMDTGITGIPVGIHTQNVIVYNKSLTEKYGLQPAQTWEELIALGVRLEQHGIPLIAVSDQDWQMRVLFLSILASTMSPQEYLRLQTEGDDIEDLQENLVRSFEILSALKKYSHSISRDVDWTEVSATVARGEALVQILGDYIIPEYPDRSNIVCHHSPEARFVIWGADSFVLPNVVEPAQQAGQDSFIDAVMSADNIIEYVSRKGGIPILGNINPEALDGCLSNILSTWNSSEARILMGGETWQKRFGAIGKFLNKSWQSDIEEPRTAAGALFEILKSM